MYKIITMGDNEAIIFDKDYHLQTASYWTEDRMKNAVPFSVELPLPDDYIETEETVSGTVEEANINVAPFNAGGKLFFTRDGKDYVASAEFSGDISLILTAAHCVRDMQSGEWSENIMFKRAYKTFVSKQSCCIRAVALKTYWYSKKERRWDYAFGISSTPSEVPSLQYQINCPFNQVTAFGYPTNYSLGLIMQRVDGSIKVNTTNGTVKMSGNKMGGGCSGGAWVKQGDTIVSGLNSFYYEGHPDDTYSPLFTDDFNSLFNYAKTLI